MPTYHVRSKQEKEFVLQVIARLSDTKQWSVGIGPYKEKRNTSQNARLWALHSMAAEQSGHSAEELHEFVLGEFFGWEDYELFGKPARRPRRRSSGLDKATFADLMTYTEQLYGTQLGVWLPDLEMA